MSEQNPTQKVEPKQTIKVPPLDDLFFLVCRTAIKNTAWKRSDFDKVAFVEGQLDQLEAFMNTVRGAIKENPAEEEAGLLDQPAQVKPETPAPVETKTEIKPDPVPAPEKPAEVEKKKS